MNLPAQRFAVVFGTCVTIATLFSGCASAPSGPTRPTVSYDDLNSFVVDCRQKAEQIRFLQSVRRSSDDQLLSLSGWLGEDKNVNYMINVLLVRLNTRCPS